ncbi:MAG: hypothetical protein IKQ29_03040 [Bacilli bacterium]|nr:hypothetical protein [Bacilli bacterium]
MIINKLPFIMLKCLICTIIIEIVIALILKIKAKKDLINILLVNILTNPIVVSIPVLILFRYGKYYSNITLYILEIITVITEGFIYKKVLKYKKINPYLISLILNLGSYLIGEIINRI